jgi:hypothetical protein
MVMESHISGQIGLDAFNGSEWSVSFTVKSLGNRRRARRKHWLGSSLTPVHLWTRGEKKDVLPLQLIEPDSSAIQYLT